MKLSLILAGILLASVAGQAQVTSARAMTKRIAPLVGPAPTPGPRGTAVPAANGTNGPAVDPEKVSAEKAATDKNLLKYQEKKAADGSETAQYSLGLRYLTGDGVEKNRETAMKWLDKSAKQGNSQAKKKIEELKEEKK